MAPSAPLPLPPPAPLSAFLEGDGTVHPSNGHGTPPDSPPVIAIQPKLPSKSNLKRHSMFGSPQQLNQQSAPVWHPQSFASHVENGLADPKVMDKKGTASGGLKSGTGYGAGVVVDSDADYIPFKVKDSRVTWTDNHGKDLAEVWEFELSDTGDSDEESDSDSSQACTCAIQ